ncbi:MAG TPA: DUF4097 family beta strand repeat-containing protein [Gemmatimonadaceae bacterium]|nr:DUF4097 family beta strand repeat-containing protein [Gemmatimonadaceae bacterium]
MARSWMIAAVAALALSVPPALAAQRESGDSDEFRSRIDTTVALSGNGTVDLSLVSGEIVVTSWNRSEVRVHATSERGILRFDASPSRVTLGVRSDRGRLGDTRYEITIPKSARVVANGVSGDVSTTGGSDVEAHSVSGDVKVVDATGRVSIESVSGDASAQKVGAGVKASTVSGELTLSDITGDVDANTVSGDIVLDGVRASFVRTNTTSGDVRFMGTLDPKGRYEFNSHSGDIRIGIPGGGATLDVHTFSGDVDSDFPMTLQPGSRSGERGKGMQFTIGGGGARITAQTFSGDITIERASGASREE